MKMKKTAIIIACVFTAAAISRGRSENSGIVLSSFSTSAAHQSQEVKQNIAIACEKLNGIIIRAGGTFSFNDTVGEGSAKNGYVEGSALYRDTIVMEAGGGLCQVSSTLYNALILAGCAIVERHRHYQPVTYVPLGLDATIKYGKKDLKIKNTLGQDLKISAIYNDYSCTFLVTGTVKPLYRYSIETDEEELTIPFAEGQEGIRPGVEVYVYRKKIKEDVVVERFLMYKDFYPPVHLK